MKQFIQEFWNEFCIAAKETPRLYFQPLTMAIAILRKGLNKNW